MRSIYIPVLTFIIAICLVTPACKKSVDVAPPVNQIVSSEVFTSDSTAKAAVLGIYSEMMNSSNQFSCGQTTFYTGLSAGELYYYTSSSKDEFSHDQITVVSHAILTSIFWTPAYKYIYAANLCLENLKNASGLTPSLRNSLMGECLFLRAFCYFYLVNLFGDVPLILSTDYQVNATMGRTSTELVYQQMITDLSRAVSLLPATYPSINKVRVNSWAAEALLARVYLYHKDWSKAEEASSSVIGSGVYSLTDLNSVFLKNSNEAILQFQPVTTLWNTWEAKEMIPALSGETPKYLITPTLFSSFEAGDLRQSSWTHSRIFNGQTLYYPYKYKVYGNGAPITEYYMILRLGEQYLIRAEARAQLSNISGSLSDLYLLRQRANLSPVSVSTVPDLLLLVEHERQTELFCEWGHRWLDLKRTGRATAVLQPLNPTTWQPTDTLYPIPSSQIALNPALTQNPGY